MTIRFKRANQISSIFITSSTDHLTGYNPLDEWPGGSAGFATYSSIELRYSTVGGPSPAGTPTGIMVRAKVHGNAFNGWEFVIDQSNVHPPTVVVVGTVVTITGDGGTTTLADILAAMLAETDVTDVWDVITLPLYEPTDVLQAEGTDGEGPVTVETINGYDYDEDGGPVGALYAKEDGHPLPFDGEILYLGVPGYDQIPGSFRVLWNIEHLDQEGDIEIYIPAATGRDPANRFFDVKSLPDGIFWEGYCAAGSTGTVINISDDLDEAIDPGGDNNTLAKSRLVVLRGLGAGQTFMITSNVAATRAITVNVGGYTVGPLDATSYVAIIPSSVVDVGAWGGTYWDTARPEVDVVRWKGSTPSSLSGSNHVQTTVAEMDTDSLSAGAVSAAAVTKIQTGLASAANLATVAGYLDTEIAAILAHVDTLEASATTLLANTTSAAIAAAVLDAPAASYVDAGSIGEAIGAGALTAAEVVAELVAYEHDTDVTLDGLFKRLEAMLGGAATNLKGTTGDGTVTYYLRDGVTVAFSGILDPVAGNRGASDVSTSETP